VEVGNHAAIEVTRLFASDVILPTQLSHPPEDRWLRRLCRAVLEDALTYVDSRGGYGGYIATAVKIGALCNRLL
jgi:hypothetical protein